MQVIQAKPESKEALALVESIVERLGATELREIVKRDSRDHGVARGATV